MRGQATSPALRAASGGIDTVMSANVGLGARSPLNISPRFVARPRVVAINISTWLADETATTGSRTPVGRLAQAESRVTLRPTTKDIYGLDFAPPLASRGR
ncbi:hypothetical protein D9M68_643210 [compost metagenome]